MFIKLYKNWECRLSVSDYGFLRPMEQYYEKASLVVS